MNTHKSRFSKGARQAQHTANSPRRWKAVCASVLLALLWTGCHRSPFGPEQTVCPGEEVEALVLDYTLNCVYSEELPPDGCPSIAPNEYSVSTVFICSERSGADDAYLQQLVNDVLDIDASTPPISEDTNLDILDATIEERDDSRPTPRPSSSPQPASDETEDD